MVGSYAIIENDVVVNRIVADVDYMMSLGVEFTDNPDAQINCVFNGKEFIKPSNPKAAKSENEKLVEILIEKGVISGEEIKSGKVSL